MRIAVLGSSRSGSDPRTIRLVNTLVSADHDVTFISAGAVDNHLKQVVEKVVRVDTRWPKGQRGLAAQIRKLNPGWFRTWLAGRRMLVALEQASPAVVYPTNEELALLADTTGFPISTDPGLRARIANDFTELALSDPDLSGIPAMPGDSRVPPLPTSPEAGRHAGKRVVMCYHPTDTNPARYLRAAFERAGVHVDHRYPEVDLATIPDDTAALIFVESPYPAIKVTGYAPCPVVYWVHHGEHHLYQNLRLARQYKADAVLLAHSWHLGHRFAVPTHRFPFAVPTEMIREPIPWQERSIEVAMIGAGFGDETERYSQRRGIADEVRSVLGTEHVVFEGGLSPEEVFRIYGGSKVVVDEGGELHRPITMRVFEAMGSGATLVTEPAPGLGQLFDEATEFLPLDVDDVVGSLQLDTRAAEIATAGHDRAVGYHTYDHRVDQLFDTVRDIARIPQTHEAVVQPFGSPVRRFAEIDSLGCSDANETAWLASSYVVRLHQDIVQTGSKVDAVILTNEDGVTDDLLDRANRYVFCSPSLASTVQSMLATADRHFTEVLSEDVAIFDFEVAGYIVRDTPWQT